MKEWGRFTVRGSDALEQKITALVTKIAAIFSENIAESQYRTIVLLGGYGRGEGGVEIIEGEEHPHNNLDFIIFTNRLHASSQKEIKQKIDAALQPITRQYGIGVDISLIDAAKLSSSPCLVMWYDMRFGHKLILGDADFLPSMHRFDLHNILPSDIRNLLVNRGTLLLINEMLLERGNLSEAEKKLFVKHIMKCVIGYGDALLFFLGDYHWSYQEKQKRMQARNDIPPEFKNLYNEAMEFRFLPDYAHYVNRDFSSWLLQLRQRLEPVHLQCERIRLHQPDLAWQNYVVYAFRHEIMDQWSSPRRWAKKILSAFRSSGNKISIDLITKIGILLSGKRGHLPILYPLIAYHLDIANYKEYAKALVNAEGLSFGEIRKAYLKQWSIYGDENFSSVLKKLGMSLE